VQEGAVGGEQERRERLALDDRGVARAPVEADVSAVGIEVTGEQRGRVVPPEDDGRAGVAQPIRSLTTLR
jgi:hypothetical protein